MTTVRYFLYQELNYFICRGTWNGQNLPDDWLKKCQKCFFWFVYTVSRENIHQSMMINADQTCDILVLGRDDLTCKVKGSK